MSKPLIIATADTHLAPRAWVRHAGLTGDSYYGLEQVVDHCVREGLPLLLAGDVFDKTRPDPMTVWKTRQQIDHMEFHDRQVFYIQGQHELDRVTPWLQSISRWPTHIHGKSVKLSGFSLYGLDWQPADAVQEEFAKIPEDTDILMAHQVWRDLMGPRIGESECAFCDVPYVQLILTGDFHRHMSFISKNKNGDNVRILSPGPLCMQSIDEDTRKYFFVIYDNLSIDTIELRTRNCFRFVIETKDDLDAFLSLHVASSCAPQEGVPNYISKNMVHVVYHDSVPEAYTRITNALVGRVHLFLVPFRQQRETVTIETEKRRALADGGLEACLELVTPKDGMLYRDLLTLLRSQNPRDQLEEMRETFLRQRRART